MNTFSCLPKYACCSVLSKEARSSRMWYVLIGLAREMLAAKFEYRERQIVKAAGRLLAHVGVARVVFGRVPNLQVEWELITKVITQLR